MKELNRAELEQCLRKMTEMTDEELNRVAGGSEAIDRTENAIRETLKNGCLIPGMFEYMMEALEVARKVEAERGIPFKDEREVSNFVIKYLANDII